MSSDAPDTGARASRRPESRAIKVLVFAILAVHTIWICVHLGLVSQNLINPWKLGGYGMYTVPNNKARLHVFLFDNQSGGWRELAEGQANSYLFDTANYLHVFRCRQPSADSIARFFDENPHLRYRPVTLALSERILTREPIGESRKIYAKLEVAWGGETKFGYRGELCGEAFDGTRDYTPPES
ncbi:MAG: hypothetical protein AAGE80_18405 [Pseudomonadota bacterium]